MDLHEWFKHLVMHFVRNLKNLVNYVWNLSIFYQESGIWSESVILGNNTYSLTCSSQLNKVL